MCSGSSSSSSSSSSSGSSSGSRITIIVIIMEAAVAEEAAVAGSERILFAMMADGSRVARHLIRDSGRISWNGSALKCTMAPRKKQCADPLGSKSLVDVSSATGSFLWITLMIQRTAQSYVRIFQCSSSSLRYCATSKLLLRKAVNTD